MRRAAQKLIAASSVLPIALGARAAPLRQPARTDRVPSSIEGFTDVRYYQAYTAVRAQRLYVTHSHGQRLYVNQQDNVDPQTGENGTPWPQFPPGFQQ